MSKKNIEKSRRRNSSTLIYIILNIAIVIVLVIAMTLFGLSQTHFLIIFGAQCAINIILIVNCMFPKKFRTKDEPKMRFMMKHGSLAATLLCGCFAICIGSQIYEEISLNRKLSNLDRIEEPIVEMTVGYLSLIEQVKNDVPENRYRSFDRQLSAIEYALRVDSNYTYYASMTKNLYPYLEVLTDSAFIGNDRKESLGKIDRYIERIESTLNNIKASSYYHYVSYDIDSIGNIFKEKKETLRDSIKEKTKKESHCFLWW